MTAQKTFEHISRNDLNSAEKLVLLALQKCSGLNVDALTTITGLSRSTCYRAVKRLRELRAMPWMDEPHAPQAAANV